MALTHTNPTKPRIDRDKREYWARAPYNFVPLPDRVVPAPQPLPPHHVYTPDDQGLTGWITCELETCSPTYIRGMLSAPQFEKMGGKGSDQLTSEEKDLRAPFFATDGSEIDGHVQPTIPGSSLRGMIRTLVEIAGYGRMRWVAKTPTFTFRAVAASKDDPLREPYREVIGPFGRNVRAGYLIRRGEEWRVQPALRPADKGWPEKDAYYLKVKEWQIKGKDIPGYLRFNSPEYRPQLHPVSFGVEFRTSGGKRFVAVSQIGPREANYEHKGWLVCSGNMIESSKPGQKSPRKNHALILDERSPSSLKIRPEAIDDYLAGLTPFQREELQDWSKYSKGDPLGGCLGEGNPVFYVAEGNEVAYFGHSPNFRIPARLSGEKRAATPADFVPKELRADPHPDLADAIFGWVQEGDSSPQEQRAGRVFISDAQYVGAKDGVWHKPEPIMLHVLATPKPTTFQHYLAQDRDAGHDPDDKATLAHYGTPPGLTYIRGHKLYWHKGANPDIEANAAEREHEKQLTRVVPLKPGVKFSFKVYFENLRPEELGAICWALALPGEAGKTYRHKLGMGKPLGMGAVAIKPQLYVTRRQERYARLFGDGGTWNEAASLAEMRPYQDAFETYILSQVAPNRKRLADVERIQMLLAMLEWHEGEAAWLDKTRYMEIEHDTAKVNEYKERPVLPDPLAVSGKRAVSAERHGRPVHQTPSTARASSELPTGYQRGQVLDFGLGAGQSYGFIQPDGGGPKVFVHRSQLTGRLETLQSGQRVIFKIGKGRKGPEAQDVRLEG